MRADRRSLGAAELDVLTFVSKDFPVSVRDVMQGLLQTHRYARTTVLTVLERLRQKGYLTRERHDGVNCYRPSISPNRLMHSVVKRFVEEMLGGTISPIVEYLANSGKLNLDEITVLKSLAKRLDAETRQSQP